MVPDEDDKLQTPVRYCIAVDPNGVQVEIQEEAYSDMESRSEIRLRVLDLNDSIEFYKNVVGLRLIRKRSNVNNRPREASMCAILV
jgi:hypothetical protein